MLARAIPFNQDAGTPNDKPILTLASLNRKRNEVNQYGLPNEKSTLGLYRFPGNDVGALSAGEQSRMPPNPRALPPPAPVNFITTGNNVYQPRQYNGITTHALISKLADNKFKAEENEPYSKYVQQLKLEREISEIEKTASVEQLGLAREVLRSAMAERRKQNEDDYLRKMLDSGLSVEDAKDEIDNVRRANALQEVKKVDDRLYQSKLLLVNLAKKRGLLSSVNEPLSQSAPVMNPAPNDQTATLGGNKADGFGNAPLDVARKFLTPEYYGRFLRRSTMTQEEGDRQQAMNNLITSGKAAESDIQFASQLDARQRESNIEFKAEALASQLSNLTNKPRLEPSPPAFICSRYYLQSLGGSSEAKKPRRVGFQDFTSMTTFQIIYAINRMLAIDVTLAGALRELIPRIFPDEPSATRDNLIVLATQLNANQTESKTAIGVRGESITSAELFREITDTTRFVTDNMVRLRQSAAIWAELIGVSEGEAAKQMFRSPTKPQVDPRRTMYFSKIKQTEVAAGRRAGDARLYREKTAKALSTAASRASEAAAIVTRIRSLGPIEMTFSMFKSMRAADRDALLTEYGVVSKGTNKQRYDRLMAVNR